jgi:hypothetical protein
MDIAIPPNDPRFRRPIGKLDLGFLERISDNRIANVASVNGDPATHLVRQCALS